MIIEAKNKRIISLRRLNKDDLDNLHDYLQSLSVVTRRRFGPHGYDKQSIIDFYALPGEHLGYVAADIQTKKIVACFIIKSGYLEHDCFRLQSYGLELDHQTDCTFAPSVSDLWQSCGVGNTLFNFMLSDLKSKGIKRILLWGGVQSDNKKAINFYLKNGFRRLGQFEYNGLNDDMILDMQVEF